MNASKLRTLLPGGEAYGLIAPSTGVVKILKEGATTDDTINTVRKVVRSTLSETKRLAPTLKGRDLTDTCSKIWHFIYDHIQYRNDDEGKEQIRHPSRIWADRKRGVDCDDYTTFASSILLNLGIPHKLRVTDYGRGWQHIYVVVPKSGKLDPPLDQDRRDAYTVIDCVPDTFDFEVRYTRKMDIPMELQILSGLSPASYGAGSADPANPGVGNIFKKIGGAIKKAGNAVAKVAKKVVASPVRAGVLVFMKLNVKQGASRLRWGYFPAYNQQIADAGYGPKAYEQIRASLKRMQKTYVDLGGRADALRGAILNSSGNKDRAVPVDSPDVAGLGYLAAIDPDWAVMQQVDSLSSKVDPQLFGVDGLGVLPAAAPALIAAATPIIIPILNMIAKAKANDPNDPIPAQYAASDDETADDAPAADEPATDESVDTSVNGLGAVAKKKKKAAIIAKNAPHLVAKTAAHPATKPAAKPAAKKPVAARSKTARPVVTRPVAVRPIVARPIVARPIVARPVSLPDSSLSPLPVTLPMVTDESGTAQVVLPATAVVSPAHSSAKVARKAKLLAKQAAKKKGKVAKKPSAATAAAAPTGAELTAMTDALTQTAQAAAPLLKQQKVAAVLKKSGRVSKAVQQVVKTVSDAVSQNSPVSVPTPTDSDDSTDSSMVDMTAETEAQAVAEGGAIQASTGGSAATAAAVAAQAVARAAEQGKIVVPTGSDSLALDWFKDKTGGTDWFKVGLAGAGAVALGALLFGKETAAQSTRSARPAAAHKGLSGTPKRARKSRKKRAARSRKGLAGVTPVALS